MIFVSRSIQSLIANKYLQSPKEQVNILVELIKIANIMNPLNKIIEEKATNTHKKYSIGRIVGSIATLTGTVGAATYLIKKGIQANNALQALINQKDEIVKQFYATCQTAFAQTGPLDCDGYAYNTCTTYKNSNGCDMQQCAEALAFSCEKDFSATSGWWYAAGAFLIAFGPYLLYVIHRETRNHLVEAQISSEKYSLSPEMKQQIDSLSGHDFRDRSTHDVISTLREARMNYQASFWKIQKAKKLLPTIIDINNEEPTQETAPLLTRGRPND
jgi:hypothetical protein